MWRRFKQIILPILSIGTVFVLVAIGLSWRQEAVYRQEVYRELASMIGSMAAEHPELDAYDFVQGLQDVNEVNLRIGEDILHKYGYDDAMLVTASADNFQQRALSVLLVSILLLCLCLGGYFWYLDRKRSRQIRKLVTYLQDLSTRAYELHLAENSEDELSLLSNELYKLVVILQEASELNRTAKQNLETALADISHQLKTPLTSMQVMIDNLYDDSDMPAEIRQDFIRSLRQQIESMSELVATLLNLAKFDNGSIKMQQKPVKIGGLLMKVHEHLAALADLQGVEINISGDLDTTIPLDSRWQTEALTNVIKNCLEHSPAGKNIDVEVIDGPIFVKIIIQDYGEGIAKNDLRHIFERFYKAKNSAADSVGIGLSFARTAIEADGGQISAKSAEGQGTTFTVKYFKS